MGSRWFSASNHCCYWPCGRQVLWHGPVILPGSITVALAFLLCSVPDLDFQATLLSFSSKDHVCLLCKYLFTFLFNGCFRKTHLHFLLEAVWSQLLPSSSQQSCALLCSLQVLSFDGVNDSVPLSILCTHPFHPNFCFILPVSRNVSVFFQF